MYVSPDSGSLQQNQHITLGARGDSYYEYLLKQWLLTGRTESRFLEEYRVAMDGVMRNLVRMEGTHSSWKIKSNIFISDRF